MKSYLTITMWKATLLAFVFYELITVTGGMSVTLYGKSIHI